MTILSLRYLGEGDGFKRVEYRLEFLDRCFPLTENRTQWPVSKAVPSLAKTQRITFSLGVLMNDLAREFSSSSIWPYCDGLITPDSGTLHTQIPKVLRDSFSCLLDSCGYFGHLLDSSAP